MGVDLGDAHKIQRLGSSSGDAIVADSSKLARPTNRATAIAVIAAVLFALVAAVVSYNWYRLYRALNDANSTIAELVEATSESVQPNAQLETADALLESARKAINNFAVKSGDFRIVEQRARTLLILAEIDLERGQIDRMRADALAAFTSLDPPAKAGNLEARHLRARAERLIGASDWASGNNDAAKLHYERGIADLIELLKRDVDPSISWRWMRSLAELHESLGDVILLRFGKPREALNAFEASLELRERLAQLGHQGPAMEHDLAWITKKRGDVEERLGNIDTALKLFSEAHNRLAGLKDRIWDNPRWARDFGAVTSNIGLIKRKQNRYAEAAVIIAQAEEILTAVHKRDPKNVERSMALNGARFLRAENLFRLAVQHNDRIRLLSAREQMQVVIAATADSAGETKNRNQLQLIKVREDAFLAAIDATLRQWNGNHESAAVGFIEAADIVGKGYLPNAWKMPWEDLLGENIEYLEWAGIAYIKAQKISDAQVLFKRALDMVDEYRVILGDKRYAEFTERIAARLDRKAPPADRAPAANREQPATAGALPADNASPTTDSVSPLPR